MRVPWRFPRFTRNRSSRTRSWNALLAGDMRRRWHVHRLHMHNAHAGLQEIVAGVDRVNTASVRILRKLGFEQVSIFNGAFGDALLFRLKPQ